MMMDTTTGAMGVTEADATAIMTVITTVTVIMTGIEIMTETGIMNAIVITTETDIATLVATGIIVDLEGPQLVKTTTVMVAEADIHARHRGCQEGKPQRAVLHHQEETGRARALPCGLWGKIHRERSQLMQKSVTLWMCRKCRTGGI